MKYICHFIRIVVSLSFIYFNCVQGKCGEGEKKPLTNWTGVIESPHFKEGRYPPNQDCTWHIQLPPGYGLKLTFLNFSLGDGMTVYTSVNDPNVHNKSCTDYVSIQDGNISPEKYCGDLLPPEFKSNNSDVYVEFHSDKDEDQSIFRGFRIAYAWICATRLIQVPDEGDFTLEPPPSFSKETGCRWTISAKVERSLALHQNYLGTSTPSGWQVCTMTCVPLESYSEWFYPGVNIDLVWQPMETQSTRVPVYFKSLVKSHPCIATEDKCQHNGTCVPDGDSYRCNCMGSYTGTNCTTEANPCIPDPCKTGGSCKFENNSHGTYCADYNVCTSSPCQRGQCRSNGSQYDCECPPGYTGNNCSKVVDTIFCHGDFVNYYGFDMHWKDTRVDDEDVQPCPFGAKGNATRFCLRKEGFSDNAFWDQMDLSDCVSKRFTELLQAAEAFRSQHSILKTSILNITSGLIAEITSINNDIDVQLLPGDLSSAADTVRTIADVIQKTEGSMKDIREVAQGYGDALGSIIDKNTALIWSFTKSGFLEVKIKELLQSTETLSTNIASRATDSLQRRRRGADGDEHFIVPVSSKNVEFNVTMLPKKDAVHETSYEGTGLSSSTIIIPAEVYRLAAENTNVIRYTIHSRNKLLMELKADWNPYQTQENKHVRLNGSMYNVLEETSSYVSHYVARFSSVAEVVMETRRRMYMQVSSSDVSVLNSDVISSKMLDIPNSYFQDLQSPVVIIFKLDNSTLRTNLEPLCVFLNMSSSNKDNQWSKTGCERSTKDSNYTHTVCHCYHLTNFAVLMDVYGIKDTIDELNTNILTYISYAGGGLSVLCCIISIVVFEFFRLRNERIRVHEQLALCIVAVQLLFLFGVDRTENRGVCMGIAIALHFFLLALFSWMLVEGIHLYMLLVKVFNSGSHLKKYMMLGWGVPIVVVGICGGVFHEDYGTGDICWLTQKMILILFVPAVGLVILINTVILLIVLRIMVRSMTHGSKVTSEERSTIRVGLKAAVILLPILGFTWIFGFLSVTGKETLVFTYLFTFFNSLQGVFFFVFHCLLSIDVQNAYDRRSKRLSHMKATESAFSKSQERRNSDFESSGYCTSKGSLHSIVMDTSTLDRKRSVGNGHEQIPVTGKGYENLIWTAAIGRSEVTRKPAVSFDDEVFLDDTHVRHRKNSSDIIRTPIDTHETESRLNGHVISYNTTPMRKRSDMSSFHTPSYHAAIDGLGADDTTYGSNRGFGQDVIYAQIQK